MRRPPPPTSASDVGAPAPDRRESHYVTARPAGPVLRAASQLCTDFGRVSDLDELKSLIGQAADLMDASGIVIWVAARRRHLRAAGPVARLHRRR